MFDGSIENPLALTVYLMMLGVCVPGAVYAALSWRGESEPRALSILAIASVATMWLALAPLNVLNLALANPMIWLFGAEEWDTGIVEYATVLAWALIAALCLRLGYRRRSWERAFYWAGAAAAIVALGEEISWGQWIFFWSSSDFFAERNLQGETNLHNFFPPRAFEVAYAVAGAGMALTAAVVRFSGLGEKLRWTGLAWLRRSRWGAPLTLSAAVMMQHHLFQELSELALAMAALYALGWIHWVADSNVGPGHRSGKPSRPRRRAAA